MSSLWQATVVAILLSGGVAQAEPRRPEILSIDPALRERLERLGTLLQEGLTEFGAAVNDFADQVPRYGMPRVLPNGDILVPRQPAPPPEPAGPRTWRM